MVLRGRLENMTKLSRTNKIYLTIVLVSLIFLNGILISAGVSNAQVDNLTRTTIPPKPSPSHLPVPNKPSNITITSSSSTAYSIPSTYVQVDRFSTNYTIAGKISSLNDSRDSITSTIVDDFDKNPNIGYVVNNSSSSQILSTTPPTTSSPLQPGIPNPFVNKDIINYNITNEIQDAIAAVVSSTNILEKHVEIKCTFGMTLADYKCS
jgi:hypothetical protein